VFRNRGIAAGGVLSICVRLLNNRMLLAQQYAFRDGKLAESRSAAGWLEDPPA
jgi:hypothetical protein